MRRALKIAGQALVLALIVLAVLWCPYQTTPIPSWKLQVLDSAGKPVGGVTAHQEWLDPINEGMTFADSRDTDTSGFVEFPKRTRHNRLAFGFSASAPSAHIFVCIGDEYGEVFLDAVHGSLMREMQLRKGSCPYG
jgi:hypothetical protein